MSTEAKLCVICTKAYKYKCSKCPMLYCSLDCFKQHKLDCPGYNQSFSTINNSNNNNNNTTNTDQQPQTETTATAPLVIQSLPQASEPKIDDPLQLYEIKTKYQNNPYIEQITKQLQDHPPRAIFRQSQQQQTGVITAKATAQQRILHHKLQHTKVKINDNGKNDFISLDDIYLLLKDENVCKLLRDFNLQQIIKTINEAPYYDWKVLLLRHQLEFNHQFALFIEGILNVLKQTQTAPLDDDAELEGKLYEILTRDDILK